MYERAHNKRQKKRGTQPHLVKEAVVFECPVCRVPAISLESSSTPAPATIPPDSVLRSTVAYRDDIATSMHLSSLSIDPQIYTSNIWLCDNSMDLVLH